MVMPDLDYYAIHEPTGKRAIYKQDFDRLAGKYMETIASPQTTDQQKEIAMLKLGDLQSNSFVDWSFSGDPEVFFV
jgi:hypothetical protein